MGLFSKNDYEKLDSSISDLKNEIEGLRYTILTSHIENSWDAILNLTKEIQDNFKVVHYPTRQERDAAWQDFFELRQEIYAKKNKWFESVSKQHKDILEEMMSGLEYWGLREGLREFLFNELNSIKAEVIENGKKLNEVGKHFSSLKHKMTAGDKSEIFNRIREISKSHDEFWNSYKERSQEIHEHRNEKKEQAMSKLLDNIESNKEKLEKAETALSKQERHKESLEEQLERAYSNNFKDRCEGWLEECEDKIRDIESYIDRLKGWIREGEDRLSNWS